MTVSATPRTATFNGSGSTGPFSFSFRVLDDDDITVTHTDADDVETTLTKTTHYTISLVNQGLGGGLITLVTALASGETLTVDGNTPITQTANYTNLGHFDPEIHGTSFDKLTMIAQELKRDLAIAAAGTKGEKGDKGDKGDTGPAGSGSGDMIAANNLSDLVSASTARTNLGLGSMATQASNNVNITNGVITGITDLAVADGGTGRSSHTAYAVIVGGITSTGAQQSIASVGTAGQVLTSAGAGAKPVMADIPNPIECITIAISDETTAITTGTAKVTFRMPYAFTLTSVKASLTEASSSGTPTFDINESGTTILSTKLTIDASEKTSTTAAVPVVISDSSLADDAEMTIDVDVAGTGAKGAKLYLIGRRT